MNVYDKLKTAFRRGTGVRLSAGDVRALLMKDVAIRDAIYPDYDEFIEDKNHVRRVPEAGEEKEREVSHAL